MSGFKDRHRRLLDDGDDFRDFVGEVLRASPGYGQPIQRDSGGVDGCIDLFCDTEGLLVECKFIGPGDDPSGRAAAAWREVRDKLHAALLSKDGRARPTRSPYGPWADSKRPIRRYVFVVSAELANEQRQRALRAEIEGFFRDEISKREGYRHLADLAVELVEWNALRSLLTDLPAIVFRWLKQWPSGYTELEDESPAGFRAYLYGTRLPYLARSSWSPPAGLQHAWTEDSIIESLDRIHAQDPFVLLVGPGGVGKSRLALELAQRLRDRGWWTVRCDGLRVDIQGLRTLIQESAAPIRLLLFADYLETWSGFEAFTNEITDLNANTGHQIRLVATCRASYRDRLPPYLTPITIDPAKPVELAYAKAVCVHILSKLGASGGEELAERCRYNLALAAFFLCLRDTLPDNVLEAEIRELRRQPNFEAWVVKRLRNAGLANDQAVAALLAACPIPATTFDRVVTAFGENPGRLKHVLASDHWIEFQPAVAAGLDEPVWATFHDVFADTVLARALTVAPDPAESIDRLLRCAAQNNVLQQTLTALERLKPNDVIGAVDWKARLLELERDQPGVLAEHARRLLSNALLTPLDRLGLLDACEGFRSAVGSDRNCDVALALTTLALSESGSEVADDLERIMLPLLDAAVARSRQSNLVLRIAFRTNQDRYREAARASIVEFQTINQTHFLMNAWLSEEEKLISRNGFVKSENIDDIQEYILLWLEEFSTSVHASFVLGPWLGCARLLEREQTLDMVEVVRRHVEVWLADESCSVHAHAQFVISGWLGACRSVGRPLALGMAALVEPHIQAWLAIGDRAADLSSRFIYRSWLQAAATIGGARGEEMIGLVQPHLVKLLEAIRSTGHPEALTIYRTWLEAAGAIGGDTAVATVELIKDDVLTWLGQGDNAADFGARYLYAYWFSITEKVDRHLAVEMSEGITKYVDLWLSKEDNARHELTALFFYRWLDAAKLIGGAEGRAMVAAVKNYVVQWLEVEAFATKMAASHVYYGWLATARLFEDDVAEEMIAFIEPLIEDWLGFEDNASQAAAQFVYWAWIQSTRGAQRQRFVPQTLLWMDKNAGQAQWLVGAWLDQKLPFEPISQACFQAIRQLRSKADATGILKHVVRRKDLPQEVIGDALLWVSRFPTNPDALNRMGPLITPRTFELFGERTIIPLVAWVLSNQDIEQIISDNTRIGCARAIVANLLAMADTLPKAEKLGRLYLIRWLRDGRMFELNGGRARTGPTTFMFDQRYALPLALLTLMERGEFTPATDRFDYDSLGRFCDWIGRWYWYEIRIVWLVDELTARFGCGDLWRRMLPTHPYLREIEMADGEPAPWGAESLH